MDISEWNVTYVVRKNVTSSPYRSLASRLAQRVHDSFSTPPQDVSRARLDVSSKDSKTRASDVSRTIRVFFVPHFERVVISQRVPSLDLGCGVGELT